MRMLTLTLGALFLAGASAQAEVPKQPNVLFIAIDDLRDWVGYLGRNPQAITPNIDRLAKKGVAFSRSYCAAPVCNPSRCALMSGMRPGTTGIYDNKDDWRTAVAEDLRQRHHEQHREEQAKIERKHLDEVGVRAAQQAVERGAAIR